ncbi:hypothetical protein D3C80_1107990 [compost metagenome]
MEVAAALALARQGSVGKGGLIGQADVAARAQLGQQGGRGGRADLFVGAEQHGPADAGLVRVGLEGLQRGQHDADSALHVGDAGPVQGAVGARDDGLEGAVGGEDGVVVAGQDDLDRRLGPGGDGQAVGVGFGDDGAAVGDGGRPLGRRALDGRLCKDGARGGLQNVENPRQPCGVAAARVDVGPVHRPLDDGVALSRDVVQHGLVVGVDPHGPTLNGATAKVKARRFLAPGLGKSPPDGIGLPSQSGSRA